MQQPIPIERGQLRLARIDRSFQPVVVVRPMASNPSRWICHPSEKATIYVLSMRNFGDVPR